MIEATLMILSVAALIAVVGVAMAGFAAMAYVGLQSRMYDEHKVAHEQMKLLTQEEIKRVREAAEKALEKPDLIAKLQADHIRRTIPVQ